jgi:hypothetical protein
MRWELGPIPLPRGSVLPTAGLVIRLLEYGLSGYN